MSYVFLILAVFMNASLSVFGKFYNRKNAGNDNANSIYNVLLLAAVLLGWGVLYAVNFSFDASVLTYSLLFAVSYTLANIGIIYALKFGPASLTGLFIALSLIFTTVWGFIFWNSAITVTVIIGLVLVVVSMTLCIIQGKSDEKKASVKWLIFVLIAMVGNAGCAIVQKTQQMDFAGKHGEMLMAFASLFSFVVFLAIFLIGGRKTDKPLLQKSWYFPVGAGLCNVALNLFVILLATSELSPNLIYPTIGVGGLIVVMAFSLAVFKEKLKWYQWLGIALGIAAVILLV